MFSRAHLLIERDSELLENDQLWGIEAKQVKDDNMFEWSAKVLGLKGTDWEGGVFRLYIKLDENYNKRPPEVCFHTIPFHPNVDMITGRPCVDFLDDWTLWKESYGFRYLLLSLQALLSCPVLERAVNQEAVNMMVYSPHAYRQMVQDCVAASLRVEAGLTPHLGEEKVRFVPVNPETPVAPPTNTAPARLGRVSFEEYHSTWVGIATSKSAHNVANPLLDAIKDNPKLQAAHFGLPVEELQDQMQRQMEEHQTLMYGKFKSKPTNEELKQSKLDQVNKMRKIYLAPRTPKTPSSRKAVTPLHSPIPDGELMRGKGDEPWDQDVDDLVAWTTKLDEDML